MLHLTPVGFLMIEHRNIESIIEILNKEIRCVEESHKVNPAFIDMVVDFFKVYADKSHHGKEEDIFFKALYQKQLAEHHKNYIDGIVEEHNQGRATVKKLINATERYKNGQKDTVEPILEAMKWLADFYPKHIEKEDKNFFCLYRKYFSEEEKGLLMLDFFEFDSQGIYKDYMNIEQELEKIMAPSE